MASGEIVPHNPSDDDIPEVITGTDGEWRKGDIHFELNISRVFTLKELKRK